MKPSHGNGITADLDSLIKFKSDAQSLKLKLSRGARSVIAGQHRSKFRGRGMDYAESRHYQPGDDVRTIDWRLSARTGETYTKVFIEERERPVFLLADFSASMYFGTKRSFKTVSAANAASLISWAAVQNGDRLGGVVVENGNVHDLKPRPGKIGALAMLNLLAESTHEIPHSSGKSDLNSGLSHLSKVAHPGSLIFLFSDLYGFDEASQRHLSVMNQHNDIIVCQILDPLEKSPPAPGRYVLVDASNNQQRLILDTHKTKTQNQYSRAFSKRKESINSFMESQNIPLIELLSDSDPVQVLQETFR